MTFEYNIYDIINNQFFNMPINITHSITNNCIKIKITCPNSEIIYSPYIMFDIYPHYMLIHYIQKYNNISGTKVLHKLIQIAYDLQLKEIILTDVANFKNMYKIGYFKICCDGISWYNKYGFKSSNYINETEYNNNFIKTNFIEYFSSKLNNNEYDLAYIINTLNKYIPLINLNNTISDIYKKIDLYIKCNKYINRDHDIIKLIAFLENIIKCDINYDIHLTLTL